MPFALVCIVTARDIRLGEFDYHADEAQHAVTGLFVSDAFRDLPIRHPIQYAYRYYAQYPAVAILHWPRLFYVFEGLSFLILGPSVVSARLTVLLFCVLQLYQWFRLIEENLDSYTAGICGAVLGLLPLILLFENSVMLEIPSLALGVATIRFGSDISTSIREGLSIFPPSGLAPRFSASKPVSICWSFADCLCWSRANGNGSFPEMPQSSRPLSGSSPGPF